jgi:hypothetical protein
VDGGIGLQTVGSACVGSNPASDDLEESLEAAAGELGQRDLRPPAGQDTLTVKARYPQTLQVCGQASASRLTVIRRRNAHLNDPDLKGRAAAVRVSVNVSTPRGRYRRCARYWRAP